MKLQLALITAVLAVSTTVAQATDTRTPDILGSVSAGSIQALSKADANKTRGQYRICTLGGGGRSCSYARIAYHSNLPNVSSNQYVSIDRVIAGLWFVSR